MTASAVDFAGVEGNCCVKGVLAASDVDFIEVGKRKVASRKKNFAAPINARKLGILAESYVLAVMFINCSLD